MDRIRDGKSFATRFVRAMQGVLVPGLPLLQPGAAGRAVFMCSVSFQRSERSPLKHQDQTMPKELPPPESLPTRQQRVDLIKCANGHDLAPVAHSVQPGRHVAVAAHDHGGGSQA